MTVPKVLKIRTYGMNFVLNDAPLHAQLRALTLHSRSGLNHELDNFQRIMKIRPVQAKALVAAFENEAPIAWALLSKEASTFKFRNGTEYNAGYGTLFEVYVSEPYRRKGIGSAILKRAKIVAGQQKLCIAPHDYKSDSFYEQVKKDFRFAFKEL